MTSAEYREWIANGSPVARKDLAGTSRRWQRSEAVTVPKPRKAIKHEEDDLQAAVWKWFGYQYPEWAGHFWATPNGGARSKATAAKMKATGTLKGVADMQLAIRRPHAAGLFLELKIGKNKVSDAQRDFLARMQAQGYATAVAYDFNAARAAIVHHIGY